MTPKRYLSTAQQALTTDNRSAENFENMQDEITALRKALREAKAEIEMLLKSVPVCEICRKPIIGETPIRILVAGVGEPDNGRHAYSHSSCSDRASR